MSHNNDKEKFLSEDIAEHGNSYSESLKLVPVAESIRYRKRAQSAEREVESLNEELTAAKSQTAEMTEKLNNIQTEQELIRKLAAVGVIDLEAAVLVAKARIQEEGEADLNSVIEQLRKEKQYLFTNSNNKVVATKKTNIAKDRIQNNQVVLERAAKRAALSGNRTDLQEYLKLRRSFV